MTLFEKTIQAFENKDIALFEEIHHEDFMFVKEFSMYSREEHLTNIKEWLVSTDWHCKVQCIHEDEFVLVMRASEVDENGTQFISNNISIKENGLYWRTIVKKTINPKTALYP